MATQNWPKKRKTKATQTGSKDSKRNPHSSGRIYLILLSPQKMGKPIGLDIQVSFTILRFLSSQTQQEKKKTKTKIKDDTMMKDKRSKVQKKLVFDK